MNKQELQRILKNITHGMKFTMAIIKKQPLNTLFRHDLLEALIRYHPTKDIGPVKFLEVRIRKPWKNKALYFHQDGVDDVSLKMCLQNLFGRFNVHQMKLQDVKSAFRSAVFKGKRTQCFETCTTYENNVRVGHCSSCGEKILQKKDAQGKKHIEVDHFKIPFCQLLAEFGAKDVEVIEVDNCLELKDKELKRKWIQFHDEKVTFRVLCNCCNSKHGTYDY